MSLGQFFLPKALAFNIIGMNTLFFDEDPLTQQRNAPTFKNKKNKALLVFIFMLSILVLGVAVYTSFISSSISQSAVKASLIRIQSEQQ